MIDGVYIFHNKGFPLFYYGKETDAILDEVIFAGVSSALDVFIKEFSQDKVYTIHSDKGSFIYTSYANLIFIVQTHNSKNMFFPKFVLRQIELQFIEDYSDIINSIKGNDYIDRELFTSFHLTCANIIDKLTTLLDKNPAFFDIFPEHVPLKILLEVLEKGQDILDGYPEKTIKIVRAFYRSYKGKDSKIVMKSLGKLIGHEVRQKIDHKTALNCTIKDVMAQINEIAIASFDPSKSQVKFDLCPVCRGIKSEEMICDFYSGFIEGYFDNPRINVEETKCKARGDPYCLFQINY